MSDKSYIARADPRRSRVWVARGERVGGAARDVESFGDKKKICRYTFIKHVCIYMYYQIRVHTVNHNPEAMYKL